MNHHLFCLTIDTDPDGLNQTVANRASLSWEGLRRLASLPEVLDGHGSLAGIRVPVTWFIRLDSQIRDAFGDTFFLLHEFSDFWDRARRRGDELGWHPHLYHAQDGGAPKIISDPNEACEELNRLWQEIKDSSFECTAFRNGEGWHFPETLSAVEKFRISFDSTAIPGRVGAPGHPMDWRGTPNQPYFPAAEDIRRPGAGRAILELPMTTWHVKAPYDAEPRLRYMNPAVRETIFATAVEGWRNAEPALPERLSVWVMICHPDELTPLLGEDILYARRLDSLCHNLACLTDRIQHGGDSFEFVTVSEAGARWKEFHGAMS